MKRFALLLFLFFTSQGYSLTLDELIQRSRQLVGDTPYYTPTPKLSDKRITDYLNEGHRYASAHGWFLIKSTTFTLAGGTTFYALPSDFQTAKRVSMDGDVMPEATLDELDYNNGAWQTTPGDPSRYYIRTTSVSLVGFYPAPESSSTGTVTFDYYAKANDLSSLSDIPFLGLPELTPLHETLPKFVAYRFYLTIGNDKLADIYAKEFLSDTKRMKEILETKPNYRPGFQGSR